MCLSNKLSCEAGSFSCHHNPYRCLPPRVLRLSFPRLEPWVSWFVLILSCSPQFIHTQVWDHQPLPCPFGSSIHQGDMSAPLSSLDECFFFNSSVVGLHTVQFSGRFFFFNLFLSSSWLWEEATCVYLHLHLGYPSPSCLEYLVMTYSKPNSHIETFKKYFY